MTRRVTTHDEDLAREVRFCRTCHELVTPDRVDWDRYDFYSDLGEIVYCRECGEERDHDRP